MARLPYSLKVLLENLLRNEDGEAVTRDSIEAVATWDADGRAVEGDRLHAQPRADAGLHRRARRSWTWPPCATRWRSSGGDPTAINPLVPVELVIDHSIQVDSFAEKLAFQKNAELEYERNQRALRVPALGPDGVRQLRGGAAQHRHLPPGEPGVPATRGHRARRPGVPRHARGHRLAHHDGQRPRRARLGRRRHRGRGGHARPAGVDAAAAGGGLPAGGRAARGLHRHRPRAHRHPDAARARRGGQVRGVLRPRPGQPAAGRPRHDRQHVARSSAPPARSSPSTPRRCATWSSPAARPSRSSWWRPTPREQGLFHDEGSEDATYSDTLELDLSTVEPQPGRAQAPAGPGGALERGRRTSSASWPTRPTARRRPRRQRRPRTRFPASDPPSSMAGQDDEDDGEPAHQHGAVAVEEVAKRSSARVSLDGEEFELEDGAVVIAAITSCTNTSNPSVMLGAGLLARNAVERGPAAQAVGQDEPRARLEGGDRLPRPLRPDRAARAARLQPRRLRLHHLHRQLGAAAGARSRRRSRRRTSPCARCSRATATSRAASTPRSR